MWRCTIKIKSNLAMQRDRFKIFETERKICPNWRHVIDMPLSKLLRFTSARILVLCGVVPAITAQHRSAYVPKLWLPCARPFGNATTP
jgi:hypothetical protein